MNRSAVDTRAVVGLLSRSIQFYSLGKTAGEEFPKTLACTADKTANLECYFGGHLIVRQGFKQVAIQGVEFKWLGRGGRQGHYPVHFHLAKSTAFTDGADTLTASTIDFATILLDLDGSLTGSTSTIDGRPSPGLTTSVSRNTFYDAPSQSPECLSYGLQTSPYTFISTVMGELRDAPGTAKNAILRGGGKWGKTPAVAIYRQWKLAEDDEREKAAPCGQVCDGQQYGCKRASLMGMAEVFQPSYLTMTQPQGLGSAQTGGLYYINTNSGQQSLSCERANPGFSPATFEGNRSYVLYNLFPQRDSKTTYQLYVGDVRDLSEISSATCASSSTRRTRPTPRSRGSSSRAIRASPASGAARCRSRSR